MGLAHTTSPRTWRRLAIILIVGFAVLRLIYLVTFCPLDLAPDEAHYWDWSRHLDWSYYSKGPLVAYLIRGSDQLLGPLAQALTGTAMPAVRFPAVLCGALLLTSLYILTVQVYQHEVLALFVVALAATLPVVNVGATLMTIDAPYTCCWGWALVLGYEAVLRGAGQKGDCPPSSRLLLPSPSGRGVGGEGSGFGFLSLSRRRWLWPVLGVVVGLGILAKYTMVLFIPSLFLLLLTARELRHQLWRPGFWIMSATAAFCCLPIVIWNAQHGWVTVHHVSGQAGVTTSSGIRWLGPLEFVGVQAGLLLGIWFIAWVRAVVANWPSSQRALGVRYLWWLSVPMFVNFLLFSVKTREEPNWPVTAYLSGLVLLAGWLRGELTSPRPWYRRLTWAALLIAVGVGTGLSLLVHDTRFVRPVLARLAGEPTPQKPLPLRQVDPTCRLRGWRALAATVDRLREEARGRGVEPVLAASPWNVPGEVSFYCAGQPQVYSVGLALCDRHSQYDLWHPNPVADPEAFRGRTFIIVGQPDPTYTLAFERLRSSEPVLFVEDGYPLAAWTVSVYEGFRGFPGEPVQTSY